MKKTSFVVFREETATIKALDEFCRRVGVSRSDFLRLALRRAFVNSNQAENKEETAKQ